MKGYNRLEQIMDYLKSHNLVTVDKLVAVTNASPATIRRDLIKLDEQGVISRTHGGVTLNRFIPTQPTTHEKMQRSIGGKTPSPAQRVNESKRGIPSSLMPVRQ